MSHACQGDESDEKDVMEADSLVIFDLQSAYGEDESRYIVSLLSL